MARPIQTPEQSLELAQEFGIKGKLDLRLDETVVPVRVVGGVARTGQRSGYFWQFARNSHAIAGSLATNVDPYDRLQFFDTPAAQAPSPATHDCWLIDVTCAVQNAGTLNLAVVFVSLPATQPEGANGISMLAKYWDAQSTVAPTNWNTGTFFLGLAGSGQPIERSPMYIPSPDLAARGLSIFSDVSAATQVDFHILTWAGPKGTRPPGL